MSTVAIPAEIVGDTNTIRVRRQHYRDDLASVAACLGRADRLGRTTGDYHRRSIAEISERYDLVNDETERRWLAYDLAHSGVAR